MFIFILNYVLVCVCVCVYVCLNNTNMNINGYVENVDVLDEWMSSMIHSRVALTWKQYLKLIDSLHLFNPLTSLI